MYDEDTHTFLSCGGDIDSEQQLAAHVIRGESTTQAVADRLIAAHTHTHTHTHTRQTQAEDMISSVVDQYQINALTMS